MDELCERVLNLLNERVIINTLPLSHELKEDHQKVIGTIKKIEAFGNVIKTTQQINRRWELTEEGKNVIQNGSHEAVVFNAIPPEGISYANLMNISPNAKVGFSKAKQFQWIDLNKKAENGPLVFRKVAEIQDNVRDLLQKIENLQINEVSDDQKQDLKKRKLLQEITEKCFLVEKGPSFTTQLVKEEKDLTPEMIATGSWQEKKFAKCNFDAMGVPPDTGYLHPLLKVKTEFKRIFLEMGFTEMPTNKYVESSFWNFDTLFQPQHHPARDLQDTFFTSDPQLSSVFPEDYLGRVKEVHSKGGYGSEGYHADWKIEEAQKNVLRTHTTAVSARMLYKLAQQMAEAKDPYSLLPVKYFSIDRVFRNETLDATHLAEFHQIEGVVAGRGFTLGNLMGILQQFFSRLGITQLKFKPAYNPYTEPSMEVFGFHSGLNKWVEVGNSGMFRPEMLRPMGLPEDVSVLGYGLSLERPTMIKYGLSNIRELVGHKVNLKMVHEFPLCRLDK